jgi:hypothetical protein
MPADYREKGVGCTGRRSPGNNGQTRDRSRMQVILPNYAIIRPNDLYRCRQILSYHNYCESRVGSRWRGFGAIISITAPRFDRHGPLSAPPQAIRQSPANRISSWTSPFSIAVYHPPSHGEEMSFHVLMAARLSGIPWAITRQLVTPTHCTLYRTVDRGGPGGYTLRRPSS